MNLHSNVKTKKLMAKLFFSISPEILKRQNYFLRNMMKNVVAKLHLIIFEFS